MDDLEFTNAGKPSSKIKFKYAIKCVKDRGNQIKKEVSKVTKKRVLKVPLEGPAAHIAARKADYEDVKQDISKWEPIILTNRKAKQLVFPLRQNESIANSKDVISRLEPSTDMEKEIKQMLESSDNVINEERVLTAAEERFLKAMCIEEAKERHKKLQKMRALLSYQEAKFKRQKKIKSKRYRRLLKKEKIATELKRFEEAKLSNDPNASDLVLQKLEELDKLRALERASLKHKKTGKWSKHHKLRAKYDETTRQALAEEAILNRKLTAKVKFEDEKCDDEDNNEVNEDDVQGEMMGANEFGAFDLPQDNPWFRMEKNNHENYKNEIGSESQLKLEEKEDEKEIDPKQILMLSGNKIGSTLPDLSQIEDDVEDENEQTKLITEAFAGDDVINEFIDEKKQDIEESKDKDICLYLPGWGSWVGPGIKENLKKKKSMTIKAKKKRRKDDKLGNVILSEKRDETIAKYQVKELPVSCNNAIMYQRSLKKPIGSVFNPATIFKQKIEPKLLIKMGAIIEPINKSALAPKRKPLGYFKETR